MPVNNPDGSNQHGQKAWPLPDELYNSLLDWSIMSMPLSRQLTSLESRFGLSISERTLTSLRNGTLPERTGDRAVPSSRRPNMDAAEAEAAIVRLAGGGPGPGGGRGRAPRNVWQRLKNEGAFYPREAIRQVLLQHHPVGFDLRMPGAGRIQREALRAAGIHDTWCVDSHEKLSCLALNMGDVSIEFTAYCDKWSHYLLKLDTLPRCRDEDDAAHVLLDVILEQGGVPLTVLTDMGHEYGWVRAILRYIRDTVAPDLELPDYPPHVMMPSKRNTVVEGLWRWLRDDHGRDLRSCIEAAAGRGGFDSGNPVHRALFYYVWAHIAQVEADAFVRYWNYHVVRAQPSKLMPSGFAPQELYDFPQHAGGINCLVPVPVAVVDHCRARLKPRTAFLSDAHQHDLDAVYVAIGSPEMVPQRGWQIFWSMYAQLGGQRIQAR